VRQWKTSQRHGSSPRRPAERRTRAHACSDVKGAYTAMWALTHNKQRGHAPSTRQLWEARRRQFAALDAEEGVAGGVAMPPRSQKQWGSRWRHKWFFKVGRLRARERLDAEGLRAELGAQRWPESAKLGPKSGPIFGAGKRTPKCRGNVACVTKASKTGYRKRPPKVDPRNQKLAQASLTWI
jgi:hypothetical protein